MEEFSTINDVTFCVIASKSLLSPQGLLPQLCSMLLLPVVLFPLRFFLLILLLSRPVTIISMTRRFLPRSGHPLRTLRALLFSPGPVTSWPAPKYKHKTEIVTELWHGDSQHPALGRQGCEGCRHVSPSASSLLFDCRIATLLLPASASPSAKQHATALRHDATPRSTHATTRNHRIES